MYLLAYLLVYCRSRTLSSACVSLLMVCCCHLASFNLASVLCFATPQAFLPILPPVCQRRGVFAGTIKERISLLLRQILTFIMMTSRGVAVPRTHDQKMFLPRRARADHVKGRPSPATALTPHLLFLLPLYIMMGAFYCVIVNSGEGKHYF